MNFSSFTIKFSDIKTPKVLIVMKFPETMIKMSLIFVVILAGISALMAFVAGSVIGGVVGLLFFAFSVWYAKVRCFKTLDVVVIWI